MGSRAKRGNQSKGSRARERAVKPPYTEFPTNRSLVYCEDALPFRLFEAVRLASLTRYGLASLARCRPKASVCSEPRRLGRCSG